VDIPEEIGRLQARVAIRDNEDIVKARQKGRHLVETIGFSSNQCILVATAISELARNMMLYATNGEIIISPKNNGSRIGVVVKALDEGPGIVNVQRAVAGGYSTSGGLGIGLSGVRRLADEFEINSNSENGTSVSVTIWLKERLVANRRGTTP